MTLTVRPAAECRYDVVALGEVMLRLDPGEGRIRTARDFRAWEGGGEYNVARGLSRCFGLRAAVVTALVDNEVGHLVESLIAAGGVDTSYIQWVKGDGIGRDVRNGLNFTERGFGVRGAKGVSDRGNTATSQMRPDAVDWDDLFGRQGVRWLHTGGIFAALSDSAAEVAIAATEAARRHGTVVSYDLNYRPSLWQSFGGLERAREVNRRIVTSVDVLIGNEEDFTASLGYEVPGGTADLSELHTDGYARMLARVADDLHTLEIAAATLRTVHSATRNDWGAIAWSRDTGDVTATHRDKLEIMDRVGGGDSFASGLAYGLMEGEELSLALEYGAAHGALAMTTPGDTTMATVAEVKALAAGAGARVQR
jgi:2-dehydro-3-deoxygluconokinase